jgi:hypothetical protein
VTITENSGATALSQEVLTELRQLAWAVVKGMATRPQLVAATYAFDSPNDFHHAFAAVVAAASDARPTDPDFVWRPIHPKLLAKPSHDVWGLTFASLAGPIDQPIDHSGNTRCGYYLNDNGELECRPLANK